jgi:peptide/nickel transport system substrate-binding protein
MDTQRSLSRRAFLSGIALTASGVILSACGGSSATKAPTSGATPAAGGSATTGSTPTAAPNITSGNQSTSANIPTPRNQTVIFEQSKVDIFDSFNTFIPNGEAYQYGVNQACRECMFYANFEQGKIIPWLATKYEYNPDFTQLTLSLNPQARWSDGEPYTADDVLFTLQMLNDHTNFVGSSNVTTFVDNATAPNPNTVVLKLKQPNPRFHYNFIVGIVNAGIRVVPKHIWEKQDPNTFRNNPPIYTGPYVLDRVIPQQFMYVWKKNPNYWNKANFDPQPQYLIWRQLLPPDASAQEFTRGNVDIPSLQFPNQQAIIAGGYKNQIQLQFQDPCPRGVWMNQESPTGLFAKVEGRQAMSNLFDRDTIGKTIWQPSSVPAKYPWAAWSANDKWKNDEIQKKYDLTFDLNKAGQLLDSIGATKQGDTRQLNGKPLSLSLITPVPVGDPEYQIAQTFAANAKKVGIAVDVKSLPGSPFNDAYYAGNYDITSHWLCGAALDPNQLYASYEDRLYKPIGQRVPDGNSNPTRSKIPELNDIATKLDVANPDDPQNKALFDQGLEAFLKNLPAMPTIQTIYPFLFNTTYWSGWPTQDNRYNISANWWAQFLFIIGKLQPTGK